MGGREIKKMKRMMKKKKKKVVVVVRMEGMFRVCMEMVIHPPVLMKPRGKTCLCVFVGRDAPAHAHSLTGHVYVYVSSLSLSSSIYVLYLCAYVCACGNTCVRVYVCECTRVHAHPDSSNAPYLRSKIFNDPVHGHIRIPGFCCEVIDTKHFQRLRDLKQLGTIYYVYDGASHNRFEHSIGTCHIATDVVERFSRYPELEINAGDKRAVALAGLCHDLGHGPFSHVFEHEWVPAMSSRLGRSKHDIWRHEDMSEKILDHLYENEHVDSRQISKEDIDKAKKLIAGEYYDMEKKFLAEIVANKRNSIDVDKFDYIARDCLNCGVQSGCDFKRLIEYMKVLDDQICFKASEVNNLYTLFSTRANLHNTVYTHRKGKAIEYMVVDALLAGEEVLQLATKLDEVDDFLELDDTLLRQIEYSKDPRMAEAQKIVRRIRRRELYKHVAEFTVPTDYFKNYTKVTARDILSHKRSGVELLESDLCVHNLKIDWTNSNKNPIDNVKFYHHYDDQRPETLDTDKYLTMQPASFMMRRIRVFSKKRDEETIDAVNETFHNFVRDRFKVTSDDTELNFFSPQKPPRKRCRPRGKSHLAPPDPLHALSQIPVVATFDKAKRSLQSRFTGNTTPSTTVISDGENGAPAHE